MNTKFNGLKLRDSTRQIGRKKILGVCVGERGGESRLETRMGSGWEKTGGGAGLGTRRGKGWGSEGLRGEGRSGARISSSDAEARRTIGN